MSLARTKPFRHQPGTVLGFRKNGTPIFPIAGGSEPPNPPPANDPPKNDPPKSDPPVPVEAVDSDGVGLGFPKDTAVAEMNADQKANYWRNQSKVQQKRADELERSLKPKNDPPKNDQQQQGGEQPNREQIEAQVRADVAKDSVMALLRTTLYSRGKNADEIDALVKYVNPESFLNAEKKPDTAEVIGYLDRVAPLGKGGGGGGLPGQGRHEQTPADPAAKGKEEAERRGFKPADRSTSSLIPK